MANPSNQSASAVWESLWNPASPYHLPSAFGKGARKGLISVRPKPSLAIPATGPVVLFNRDPWGSVSVELQPGSVCGLDSASHVEFNAAEDGSFTAKVCFPALKYEGTSVVKRGIGSTSAIRAAGLTLKPVGAADDDDANLTLARSYQSELLTTDSGAFMVGSYYDNNETYNELFQIPAFALKWRTQQTDGKVTADFAAQTSNAAQPANRATVSVNGTPDQNGYSSYNAHSWLMQGLVYSTCSYIANQSSDPDKKARYQNAANDALNFKSASQPHAGAPQTVDNVLNTVSTTPPPSKSQAINLLQVPPPAQHAWMAEIDNLVETLMPDIRAEIDSIESGAKPLEQTGLSIPGTYTATVPPIEITLTGKMDQTEGASPAFHVTGATGEIPEVAVQLSAFPGELHPAVQESVDRAGFLKSVLGKRIATALKSAEVRDYVGRMLTLSAGGHLGS